MDEKKANGENKMVETQQLKKNLIVSFSPQSKNTFLQAVMGEKEKMLVTSVFFFSPHHVCKIYWKVVEKQRDNICQTRIFHYYYMV